MFRETVEKGLIGMGPLGEERNVGEDRRVCEGMHADLGRRMRVLQFRHDGIDRHCDVLFGKFGNLMGRVQRWRGIKGRMPSVNHVLCNVCKTLRESSPCLGD